MPSFGSALISMFVGGMGGIKMFKLDPKFPAAVATFTISLALGLQSSSAKDNLVTAFQGSIGSPITKCHIEKIAAGIAEITGQKSELHAGGSAFASPKKLYTQLARGITDLSMMPLAYTPGRFPIAETAMLPLFETDNKKMTVAVNKLIGKYLKEEFKGTKPLAIMALPPYQLHLNKPVEDIASDLKGKRIRVVGKGLTTMFRKLDADVVSMPITQVYENMQKSVMDGFVLPNAPLAIFKQHEVSNYHVQANISVALVYIGLSQKYWASLSDDHKRQIEEKFAGPQAGVRYVSCFDKITGIALKLAQKNNGVVRQTTAEERAKLRQIADPVVKDYVASIDKKGKPASDFLKDLRAELAATN